MLSTKKVIGILFFALLPAVLFSQTVNVKKEKSSINGEQLDGYEVTLEGKPDEVRAAFIKYLKPVGKQKQSGDYFTITEPSMNGIAYVNSLFAMVKDGATTATAWIGFNKKDWNEADAKQMEKDLQGLIKEFGVKFYRDKIQVQVDESERANQAVEKQQQRLTNESKQLASKLEDNKREKIQLEKSIENNKLELEELLKKIEKNKHAQDSVAQAGLQIKKVVESHKERQRKVK